MSEVATEFDDPFVLQDENGVVEGEQDKRGAGFRIRGLSEMKVG